MSVAEQMYLGIDRRINSLKDIDPWDLLSHEQQFSVCSLGQAGYVLSFVRRSNNCYIAVLTSTDKVAMIDCNGHINISAKIVMRS